MPYVSITFIGFLGTFLYAIWFNPYNNPLLASPFCIWENENSVELRDLNMIMLLRNDKDKIRSYVYQTFHEGFILYITLPNLTWILSTLCQVEGKTDKQTKQ